MDTSRRLHKDSFNTSHTYHCVLTDNACKKNIDSFRYTASPPRAWDLWMWRNDACLVFYITHITRMKCLCKL